MTDTEHYEHPPNCESHAGKGCDCGLTGMARLLYYNEGNPEQPTFKAPKPKLGKTPDYILNDTR